MLKVVPVLALAVFAHAMHDDSYRKLPCKAPELASSCFRVHGRLRQGNGTPSTRLWQIGTHHVYGIYSNQYGFKHDDIELDNEGPELPANIRNLRYKKFPNLGIREIFGDFDVCPLEPRSKGHMQAACIASVDHVFSPDD